MAQYLVNFGRMRRHNLKHWMVAVMLEGRPDRKLRLAAGGACAGGKFVL